MPPADPDLPKNPLEYRRRPLLGVGFWALIAFGVLCLLAGAGVALLGPRLLPSKDAMGTPAQVRTATRPAAATAPVSVAAPVPEVIGLKARIASLESQGARTNEAAISALAAAALLDTAQSSRPFSSELTALRRAAPDLSELAALETLARTGAPSRGALALSFADVASRAASRSRKPPEGSGLTARIAYALGKWVTVRRIDTTSGNTPDAIVADAEQLLAAGDIPAALTRLDGLPPKGRQALGLWREEAERRAEIDREVAALRARAVRDLTAIPPLAAPVEGPST